jgi:calcium/calmodulin-dependent protein kinase I
MYLKFSYMMMTNFMLTIFDRIITYVLLCGYSPFRSEDPKQLVQETLRARIEFHSRYWSNISDEGTSFSPSLPFIQESTTMD